jgi:hypothetical protein
MTTRFRQCELLVLWAWVVFVLAGLGFYGLLDDNPLSHMTNAPTLELSVLAVQAGAVLALLGVTVGGLPIGWSVARFAVVQRRRDILALLVVPAVCALVLGLAGITLVIVANVSGAPTGGGVSLFFSIVALFPVAAISSAAAVSAAVVRSPVSERWYRQARLPNAGAVAAMALTFCAVVAWGISANAAAPQAFHGALGLLGLSTDLSWVGVLAGLGLATIVAAVALARSFKAGQRHIAG